MALQTRYTEIVVGTRQFSANLHYFDIEVHDEGIAGFFMWRTNQTRFAFHNLKDFFKRRSRDVNLEKIKEDHHEYSFFIKWEDIQGVVTYDRHKDVMIRTSDELYQILFRRKPVFTSWVLRKDLYADFVTILKEKIGDKVFSRDNKKMPESVYEGMPDSPDLIVQTR